MSLDTIDKVVEYLVDRIKTQQKELDDSRDQYDDGDAESSEFYSEDYGRLLEAKHILSELGYTTNGEEKESTYDLFFEFGTNVRDTYDISSWDIVGDVEELKHLPQFLRDLEGLEIFIPEDESFEMYDPSDTDESVVNRIYRDDDGDGDVYYRFTMQNMEEDEYQNVKKLITEYKLDKFVNNN
tara:strand:+ start:66 stop:614 length:549 start_codon:yes stop_codon:yes gene_type:complete